MDENNLLDEYQKDENNVLDEYQDNENNESSECVLVLYYYNEFIHIYIC